MPQDELTSLHEKGLLRSLREVGSPNPPLVTIEGRELLNFSSNDYLGLASHPALAEAATKAIATYGTGSTASRLVCGSLDIYHKLEAALAAAKKTEAALSFSNGYATALGTIPAIVGKGDTVILDKLAHASLIDGARLSGATLRVFPHNDLNKLERLLKTAQGRILVVTESVFSMDGDLAPLSEIVALKSNYQALLLLDEAHAVGVLGPNGQGLAEQLDLQNEVDFQMGTLGKALGSAGGYIATTRAWVDFFINKARAFIYSTAPPPSQAAASLAALQLIHTTEGIQLLQKLQANIALLATLTNQTASPSPIIPVIIGENAAALAASQSILEDGFLVPAIRYPTVPRNTARLRITLSALHSEEQIQDLANKISSLAR